MLKNQSTGAVLLPPAVAMFKGHCNSLRSAIDQIGKEVKSLRGTTLLENDYEVEGVDKFEARDNITLAFRHLEDARMRLGKAIQATEGGVSCYDRANPPTKDPGQPVSMEQLQAEIQRDRQVAGQWCDARETAANTAPPAEPGSSVEVNSPGNTAS